MLNRVNKVWMIICLSTFALFISDGVCLWDSTKFILAKNLYCVVKSALQAGAVRYGVFAFFDDTLFIFGMSLAIAQSQLFIKFYH